MARPKLNHASVALAAATSAAVALSFACSGQIGAPQQSLCDGCDTGAGASNPGGPGAGGPGAGAGPGGGAGGNGGGASAGAGGALPLGVASSTRFARLSHTQWENSVRDLMRFDKTTGLSSAFPPDSTAHFDTETELKSVSELHWKAYQTAAEEVARQAASDGQKLAAILPPGLPAGGIERAQAFARGFGRRAFRRPLTDDEVAAYAGLFEQGPQLIGGDPLAAGVELAVQAFLQSPFFLYRVETSAEVKGDRVWLGGFEVAARLSYSLLNSTPSDALLDAAQAGELASPGGVEKWARELLKDERAAAALASFHGQLFDTAGYGKNAKSAELFPQFTKELEPLLKEEARLFFHEIIAKEQGGLRQVLTSPATFVNDRLAPFYKLGGAFGPEMKRVDLDPKQRSGVMTQIGFLAKNGGLVQSDPIHRGVNINLKLLCLKLTAPNMIPALPEQKPGQTNRQRVEAHTSACGKGCHDTRINPIGFAFEHFDTVGGWRDTDNGQPVDAKASLQVDGQERSFDGAPELMKILAESPQVHRCYAAGLAEYALGRAPAAVEQGWVEQLSQASLQKASTAELLVKLAVSDVFRARPASDGGTP